MSEKFIKQITKDLENKAKAKGLSINKMFALAGMQPCMWHHWKKGRYSPRLNSFQKLHDVVDAYK